MNKLFLLGNISTDLELKQGQNNIKYLKFNLAVNKKIKDKKITQYLPCIVFNETAKMVCDYFSKGSEMFLEGEVKYTNEKLDNGTWRNSFVVNVNNIIFTKGSIKKEQNVSRETKEEVEEVLENDDDAILWDF